MLLAEETGVNRRTVHLRLTGDALEVEAQDIGPAARATWNDGDYEFGIRLAIADLPRLAHALVERHYRGNLAAVDDLRRLAEANGIAANFWNWT